MCPLVKWLGLWCNIRQRQVVNMHAGCYAELQCTAAMLLSEELVHMAALHPCAAALHGACPITTCCVRRRVKKCNSTSQQPV